MLEKGERDRTSCISGLSALQAEELELARQESDSYRHKLAATELELAKQLDALRELQWRLDSVVGQLGLQRQVQQGAECAPPLAADRQSCNGSAAAALLSKVGRHACLHV